MSLAPKAFDVLRYLVEHADRLVTQEEILEALWPDIYVNPEVVKKYVLGIRKVLGDQTSKPVFVATFPRRGYQFIAPLRDEAATPRPSASGGGTGSMVGRERALAQLDAVLRRALDGQRQIVFVTGEAGIGKTTLVDAFQQTVASEAKVRIARGQCVEGFGGKEAYYPILDAVGQLLRDADDGPIVQTFCKRAPTWLVQFPSLLNAELREVLEKEIIGASRERMVRELCETLEAITAQTPLVLCLEDLHWVDPSTLDFVSALARRRGPARLLLLATYRPADVIISNSPLKALKQDLVLHSLGREVGLERLEQPDIAQYLSIKFAKGAFPESFSNLIHRHSGGNALFMVTILQDMLKKGLIARVDGEWVVTVPLEEIALSVPETLDQLIEAQFRQLSALEQRILRTASVAGERFSVWAITTAAEMDAGVIEDACEGLAQRLQFIKAAGIHELANGQISAHYEFQHSLYREVLYRRLSEVARSRLHLLLAQRLRAFCDPCEQELATELALHFEGGYDYEQAVRYLILAAENAVGRFAYRDSIEILNHALALVAKLDSPLREDLEVQVLEFVGDAQFALGALAHSAEAYTTAASRAQQAGLKAAQLHALTSAMYPLGFIDPSQGLAAVQQAVELSASVEDPSRLALTQMVAAGCRLVFDSWSHADADLCRAAYQALSRQDGLQLDAYQKVVYAHVLLLEGNYREALELCESGILRAPHGVCVMAHFGVLSAKTSAYMRMGHLGKVLQIIRSGLAAPDENVARYWLLSFREAWLRTLVFDFEGARRICQATGKVGGQHPDSQAQVIDQMAAGYIALYAGDCEQAAGHFRQVHDPASPTRFFLHWAWRMMAQLESIKALLLSGDIAQAQAAGDSYLNSALSTADPQMRALAWEMTARVALAGNDLAGARDAIEHALAIVGEFEILVAAWQTYATAWQVHRQLKDHKTAETYRLQSEACIHQIAGSFELDEPLRATFLAAAPIQAVLQGRGVERAPRPLSLRSRPAR